MDSIELYLKRVDAAVARENSLEKEMLDSDVHHLEVRTAFFDKLAVLAAGSLAVGISFMTAGGDNGSFRSSIHAHLFLVVIAFVLVLLSLVLCIIHNSFVSRAVFLLSSQLEELYKSANKYRAWRQTGLPHEELLPADPAYKKVQSHYDTAEEFRRRKTALVDKTRRIGTAAVSLLILGYVVGIVDVLLVIYKVK